MSTDLAPAQPTIRDRLKSPAMIAELGKAMPKHCSPDRMSRIALTALTRTPKLLECEEASFFRCMLELSQWGLEPDGRRAHLIPFENRKRGVVECQLIIDYKGYIELAYRSGSVSGIHADVVCEGDVFDYRMGSVVDHKPWFLRTDGDKPKEAGKVIAAYCIVQLKDGVQKHELMSHDEIEGIRKRSRAGNSGPWVTDWREMAKKTVFRRASKWIPLSADIRDAFERDYDGIDALPVAAQPKRIALDDLAARIEGKTVIEQLPEPKGLPERLADCTTVAEVDALEQELAATWDKSDLDGLAFECDARRELLK